jgi:hypothetical protein
MKKEKKEVMDYLAEIASWVLGGAMFIYLGFRTLDFAMFTFREEDVVFAYLVLFSTTIGAIIFALIWKRSFYFDRKAQVWRSDEFRKTVSLVMMCVCAFGEVLLAVADMSIVTAEKGAVLTMDAGEVKLYMWLTAGLAALVGAAIAAIKLTPPHPLTDPQIDMSELDANNNGVMDRHENKQAQQKPVNTYAQDAELVRLREEIAALKAGSVDAPKESPSTHNQQK